MIPESRPAMSRPYDPGEVDRRWGFVELFLLANTFFNALLYLPGTQPLRVPIRIAPFALSLFGLVQWAGKSRKRHPAYPWLLFAFLYWGLMILHPTTNSLRAGLAQTVFSIAIAAPVFWVPGLIASTGRVHRLLQIMLVCNAINAAVGILQVYDPDRWLPREFSTIAERSYSGILTYEGPDGRQIVRPPGLSDTPGGVCAPAVIAALLGAMYATAPYTSLLRRLAATVGAFLGIAAIYLSHVRSSFLVMVGSLIAYLLMLFLIRERQRALILCGLGGTLLAAALLVTLSLGGTAVLERVGTLVAEDPVAVYQRSGRASMVQQAFTELLWEYPFGAGLGRWGMMRTYFGDPANHRSPAIWAEVQFPAWILDGGVVLLTLYSLALGVTVWREMQTARRSSDGAVRSLGAMIFALNLGTIALTFSYVPFSSNVGVQYWFLTGALHGAATLGGLRESVRVPFGMARALRRTPTAPDP